MTSARSHPRHCDIDVMNSRVQEMQGAVQRLQGERSAFSQRANPRHAPHPNGVTPDSPGSRRRSAPWVTRPSSDISPVGAAPLLAPCGTLSGFVHRRALLTQGRLPAVARPGLSSVAPSGHRDSVKIANICTAIAYFERESYGAITMNDDCHGCWLAADRFPLPFASACSFRTDSAYSPVVR